MQKPLFSVTLVEPDTIKYSGELTTEQALIIAVSLIIKIAKDCNLDSKEVFEVMNDYFLHDNAEE